jgi:hypothetical protein
LRVWLFCNVFMTNKANAVAYCRVRAICHTVTPFTIKYSFSYPRSSWSICAM